MINVSLIDFEIGITIKGLFGEYCTGNVFHHDEFMTHMAVSMAAGSTELHQSQTSVDSSTGDDRLTPPLPNSAFMLKEALPQNDALNSSQVTTTSLPSANLEVQDESRIRGSANDHQQTIDLTLDSDSSQNALACRGISSLGKRPYEERVEKQETSMTGDRDDESTTEDTTFLVNSQGSSVSARSLETRRNAFNAMLGGSAVDHIWSGLISTTNNHTHSESELGEE